MLRKMLGVLLASTLLVVGANTAYAASASHITIGYSAMTKHFHGTVSSPNAECKSGRTVEVFKKGMTGPILAAKVKTGSGGGWTASVMHASGSYWAVTPKQKEMGAECARAKSGSVSVM